MFIGTTLSPTASERRSIRKASSPPSVAASRLTEAKSGALAPMKRLAPGAELPNVVYLSVALCFVWLLLAAWFAFGRDRETDFSLAIVFVFFVGRRWYSVRDAPHGATAVAERSGEHRIVRRLFR